MNDVDTVIAAALEPEALARIVAHARATIPPDIDQDDQAAIDGYIGRKVAEYVIALVSQTAAAYTPGEMPRLLKLAARFHSDVAYGWVASGNAHGQAIAMRLMALIGLRPDAEPALGLNPNAKIEEPEC